MSVNPQRIQRKRTKGWRTPEGAIYVGRPTKWGNPFRPSHDDGTGKWSVIDDNGVEYEPDYNNRDAAVYKAAELFDADFDRCSAAVTHEEVRVELAGKDLVCWCPLDQPCHADVLLRLANKEDA